MNKKGGISEKAPSAWSLEFERTQRLFNQWLDYHLNRFFDLSVRGPQYRSIRVFLLSAGFMVFAFIIHILLYSFSAQASAQQTTLASLAIVAVLTFFRLLFILWIPIYIAVEMAGNYVTDIFELKNPAVAWKFIGEISLNGASEVLHIRDGKIAEEDHDSPILLIGGPGRVEVEFDTAVLFEKSDGTPHVIGPADMKPDDERRKRSIARKDEKDPAVLEGFERLRDPIINLRDQYFGNTASDAITVEGRSLDGIPVRANDARVIFSVHRGDDLASQTSSKEKPYLYNPQSIQELIYNQSIPVLQGNHPSGEPSAWTNTMRVMVSSEISGFMSQNKLAEFLASISTPEIEAQEYREDTILLQTLQYSDQLPVAGPETFAKPSFHPRTELSDRFMRYTEGFSKRANDRGMDLHWIGVGTWKAPSDLINERHVEAWRIGLENTMHSRDEVLEKIMDEACLSEKLRLIKDVPNTYRNNWLTYRERRTGLDVAMDERLRWRRNGVVETRKDGETIQREKAKAIEALLQEFWEQMGNALEFYYNNNIRNKDMDQLEKAILKIESLLRIPGGQHMVGGGSLSKVKARSASHVPENAPPAPASKLEEERYRELLTKLKGSYKTAEAMIANEQRRHPALTRDEAMARIVKRLERYGK